MADSAHPYGRLGPSYLSEYEEQPIVKNKVLFPLLTIMAAVGLSVAAIGAGGLIGLHGLFPHNIHQLNQLSALGQRWSITMVAVGSGMALGATLILVLSALNKKEDPVMIDMEPYKEEHDDQIPKQRLTLCRGNSTTASRRRPFLSPLDEG